MRVYRTPKNNIEIIITNEESKTITQAFDIIHAMWQGLLLNSYDDRETLEKIGNIAEELWKLSEKYWWILPREKEVIKNVNLIRLESEE